MIAKVVIESPLPQLDRVFEYKVPNHLSDQIGFGMRVRIAIGHSKKLHEGFVVGITDEPEYQGALGEIHELVSNLPVLTEKIYELSIQLAKRQACTVGEILKSALVSRSVAVEKNYLLEKSVNRKKPWSFNGTPVLQAFQIGAKVENSTAFQPHWSKKLIDSALRDLEFGSVIICVPTESDLRILRKQLASSDVFFVDYSSAQATSKRYTSFLRALTENNVLVVGNRNALYAPLFDLQSIVVWDEFDFSHTDQASPYLHSRDIALIRQSIEKCNLTFASLGFSTEIQRLISMGYLSVQVENMPKPRLSYEEDPIKAESLANQVIKKALKIGPVLIQVSALGHSVALYCKDCQQKIHCGLCAGPLWLDQTAKPVCRWCNSLNFDAKCSHCGSKQIRQGRPGSTRSASEFGKLYPGIQIIESTGDNRVEAVKNKPCLVVSTPGCEPLAESGYQAVILSDARNQLSWDSLRSVEVAVHAWNRATSLLGKNGVGVLAGVGGKLAEQYVLWQQQEISSDQLRERLDLQLPPAIRLASITGEPDACAQVVENIGGLPVEILGPTASENGEAQYLVKYPYRVGIDLAGSLKSSLMKTGASKKSGTNRSSRNVRIKMDDRQVI